ALDEPPPVTREVVVVEQPNIGGASRQCDLNDIAALSIPEIGLEKVSHEDSPPRRAGTRPVRHAPSTHASERGHSRQFGRFSLHQVWPTSQAPRSSPAGSAGFRRAAALRTPASPSSCRLSPVRWNTRRTLPSTAISP